MKILLYFILLFMLLIVACNSNQEKDSKLEKIEIFEKEMQSILSSNLLTDVQYISLSDGLNAPIGATNKLVVTDSCFYILDREQTQKLFQFNLNGKLIQTIGTKGRGPGEIGAPTDFAICEYSGKISLLDVNRKITSYTTGGDFLNEQIVNQGDPIASRMLYYNGVLFLYTSRGANYSSDYSIIKIDNQENQLSEYEKIEIAPDYSIQFISPLYLLNDKLKFFDVFDGILYEYRNEEDNFKPKYILDFNDKGIPTDVYCSFSKFQKNSENYAFLDKYFIEGEDYIYYLLIDNMDYKHGFYSKKQKTNVLINLIENDQYIFRAPEDFHNGFFYTIIQPTWFLDQPNNYSNIIEEFSLTVNSNPIIMKYKIKLLQHLL